MAYGDKTERLNIRCSPMDKIEIENKAKASGKTLTEYVLACALGVVAGAVVGEMLPVEPKKEKKKRVPQRPKGER